MHQDYQYNQARLTLHPSDSDSVLSEDSISQRKVSEDPLSKYSRADSNTKVGGNKNNSNKNLIASVQEDFGRPIKTKLADVLERIWDKAKSGDSPKEKLKIC